MTIEDDGWSALAVPHATLLASVPNVDVDSREMPVVVTDC